MKRRAALAIALAAPGVIALALSGCAATPPAATPVVTRSFGADDFFSTDPRVLRAAVRGDARVAIQSVDLDVRAHAPANQTARYVIRLQRELAPDPRLEPAPAGQRWQLFALDADNAVVYETVRGLLTTLPRAPGYSVEVQIGTTVGMVPAGIGAALPLRIDLMTDIRGGWFTVQETDKFDPRGAAGAPVVPGRVTRFATHGVDATARIPA